MAKGSGGTILLLGGLGVAVYGYMNGWFNSLFGGTSTLAALPPTPATPAQPAARPVPALGSTVTNAMDLAAQAAAKDPYIIFAGDVANANPPAGYQLQSTQDKGNIFLRNDIASVVQAYTAQLQAVQQATAGLIPGGGPTLPPMTLSIIQGLMTKGGLSGLGDFTRHMYARSGR